MKNTELTKRIIATVLSLIMVIGLLPFSAFAADSDANIENSLGDFFDTSQKGDAPEQFNTAGDPYGEKGAFNLAPQNELMKIFTGGSRESTNNDAYITDGFQLGQTTVNDYSNAGNLLSHIENAVSKWSYLQAVAFDPAGVGRDTHVAFVGYVPDEKAIRVGVYDAVNGKISSNNRWVVDASWIAEADGHSLMQYSAYNYMSITAGDYDGDGKETIVVFGSGDGTSATLKEWYFSTTESKIYEQAASNSLLHEYYISAGKGNSTAAGEKLGADLTTGDFDGDGIDDLAVVSYLGIEGEYDAADMVEYIAPYLAIALGCGKGTHIVNQSSHNITARDSATDGVFELTNSNEDGFVFPASPSIAAGNIDNDSCDEIVIGGYSVKISGENAFTTLEGLVGEVDGVQLFSYDVSATAVDRVSSVNTTVNTWTSSMFELFTDYLVYLSVADAQKSFSFPQLSLDFVRTNGAGTAEDLFVNGSFMTYSVHSTNWDFQWCDSYFNSSVTGVESWKAQIGFITNTSVGVFNDNLLGREQIACTVWIKDGASSNLIGTTDNADDYSVFAGISGGRYYNDTASAYGAVWQYASSGLTAGYDSNEKQEFHNTGFDYGDAKNLLFVAVDVDNDGVLAKYADKDYAYSDPTVITVLQASPYYSTFGYPNEGKTSYTFETSFIVGQTTSNSSSFSIGASLEAESPFVKSSISSGYTGKWDESFTSQFETTYSTTFTATKDNVVVMQRTPVILYKYLLQKSDGTWSDAADENGNYMVIAVPAEPVYALVTVEEYNAFVNSEYYKDSIEEHRLSPINTDELLGNAGNPVDYFTNWPEGATNLSASTYSATTAPGSITSAYSASSSETLEQSTTQGFYFESSVSAGFSAFGSGVFAGIEFSTEGSTTQGSFTTTVDSTTVSGTVANLGESGLSASSLEKYVFEWQFGSWKLNLGSNADIYAYGYRVMDAQSVEQIIDLTVTDGDGDTEEAVLTWRAVEGATEYAIYAYENGEYTKLATTAEATYTYTMPTDSRQYEFTFAVTYTKDGQESIHSNRATYYRQSYGLSAYEIALQNGFEGTVEEWLESLVGADGEDGVGIARFSYNNAGELLAHLTDGTIINLGVIDGEDGENGLTPYIDENGNWWIGETDTGVKATGEDGKDGIDGITPQLRINTETNEWEVSLDNGATWSSTGVEATGEKGDKGDKGDTGTGITGITLDEANSDETKSVYIITLTDNTTYSFTVSHGADGADGAKGEPGADGITPQLRINSTTNEWEVSLDNGTTWSSTGVVATGAKGDKGDKGDTGEQGEKGDKGDKGDQGEKGDAGVGIKSAALDQDGNLIITLTDDSVQNLGKIVGMNGIDGEDGSDGKDGVGVKSAALDQNGNLIITLTDDNVFNLGTILGTNGKDGADGKDGKDGKDGINGKDGVNGKDGTDGKDGTNGKDGADGKDGLGVADIKIDEDGNFIFTMSDGSTINAGSVPKDDSVQAMAGVNEGGITQEDINTVKTLATVATILSSISLLWNLISLFALIGKKKKAMIP